MAGNFFESVRSTFWRKNVRLTTFIPTPFISRTPPFATAERARLAMECPIFNCAVGIGASLLIVE